MTEKVQVALISMTFFCPELGKNVVVKNDGSLSFYAYGWEGYDGEDSGGEARVTFTCKGCGKAHALVLYE